MRGPGCCHARRSPGYATGPPPSRRTTNRRQARPTPAAVWPCCPCKPCGTTNAFRHDAPPPTRPLRDRAPTPVSMRTIHLPARWCRRQLWSRRRCTPPVATPARPTTLTPMWGGHPPRVAHLGAARHADGGAVISFTAAAGLDDEVQRLREAGVEFTGDISDHDWGRIAPVQGQRGKRPAVLRAARVVTPPGSAEAARSTRVDSRARLRPGVHHDRDQAASSAARQVYVLAGHRPGHGGAGPRPAGEQPGRSRGHPHRHRGRSRPRQYGGVAQLRRRQVRCAQLSAGFPPVTRFVVLTPTVISPSDRHFTDGADQRRLVPPALVCWWDWLGPRCCRRPPEPRTTSSTR